MLQRFVLSENPEKFLKAPLCGTFKNFSVLLIAWERHEDKRYYWLIEHILLLYAEFQILA